jgi:cellulose synthase/poly-beta-1,6-N-acetylglucosamine synthase-like glycosyltransferase
MVNIGTYIVNAIEILVFLNFLLGAVYVFIFALGSLMYRSKKRPPSTRFRSIALLIPAYKEDAVIVEVARQALSHDYPTASFKVVVIADSLQMSTLSELRALPLEVVEVSFTNSTKVKALNSALNTLTDEYEIAVVLDADNIMLQGFLKKINQAFDDGFKVVQGHRIAKNNNSDLAILDAISEELNNSIFRKGHRALGFSSALIGSGMAFDYQLFKEVMTDVKAIGGFDKELEMRLLREKIKIEYLNDALVADEKVPQMEDFKRQRRRWLSAQYVYFGRFFFSGVYHLFTKANFDFFDKVYQMIVPPRILLVGISFLITLLYGILQVLDLHPESMILSVQAWSVVLALVSGAFVMAVPTYFYSRKTLHAIRALPKVFFEMFMLLFRLRGANERFIHTRHGQQISEK